MRLLELRALTSRQTPNAAITLNQLLNPVNTIHQLPLSIFIIPYSKGVSRRRVGIAHFVT